MRRSEGWWRVLLIAVHAGAMGCGSDPASSDGARIEDGASSDAARAEDAAPAGDAGSPDSAPRCTTTIDEFCRASSCPTDWPADVTRFCWDRGSVGPAGAPSVIESCGKYRVLVVQGVDMQSRSYYDAATGKLVAFVTERALQTASCIAGPSDFEEPACGVAPVRIQCVQDAGAEGSGLD